MKIVSQNTVKSKTIFYIFEADPTKRAEFDKRQTGNLDWYFQHYGQEGVDDAKRRNEEHWQILLGQKELAGDDWRKGFPWYKKYWEGTNIVFEASIKPTRISASENNQHMQVQDEDGILFLIKPKDWLELVNKLFVGELAIVNGTVKAEFTFVKTGDFVGIKLYSHETK